MAVNQEIDITHLPIGALRPDPADPRRISDDELDHSPSPSASSGYPILKTRFPLVPGIMNRAGGTLQMSSEAEARGPRPLR